ncbi:MAG: hypothetical protein ACAH80_17585, partial [Alphaproteobacteria bacterium]
MAKAERNAFLYSTGRLISELPPELLIPKKFDPKLVKPIRILHYYPGLKHEVECVYGHLHKEGAVCLFQDGQIGPVGQECVKKYFGEAAWLDIKKNWNVQINAEYAESRIAPSLHRFARLQAALPPFADILKVRDNFFYRLDALAEKFYGRLRGVVLETGFGVSAMSTNSGLRFNECLDSIEKARLQYNAAKVTKKNLVKGEELYQ